MGDRAGNFERGSGRTLSAGYRTFLDKYDGGLRLPDLDVPQFQYALADARQLLEPYTLEGTGLTRPFFSAHILHLARLRDAGVLIFDGAGPDPVSPARFESMVTIGTGAPAPASATEPAPPATHLLVLDPADGSLRCVPTDAPAVVRKVADSFARWLAAAKRKAKAKPRKTATKKRAPKPPTPATLLASFKRKNKVALPPAYSKFVKAYDGAAPVAGPDGTPWVMATLAELADPQTGTVTGTDGKPLPSVRLTRVLADQLEEQGVKALPVWGEEKEKFTLARLAKAVCVGHANGDPLFLDPTDKFSVWGFAREGQFVGKVADTFALFLKPKPPKKARATKAKAPRKAAAPRKPRAKAASAAAPAEQTTAIVPVPADATPVTETKAARTKAAAKPKAPRAAKPKAPAKPKAAKAPKAPKAAKPRAVKPKAPPKPRAKAA